MKIAILGFAREGRSVFNFLKKDKKSKNAEIWIVDKKSTIKLPRGCRAQSGKNYLKNLDRFDIIFRSPGIPYLLPEIQKAKKEGVEISSATKLFFERCPGIIVGVTGTKGKGTVSTILYRILRNGGEKAFLAGNIGNPALDVLPKIGRKSIVIFELSSFQLQDLKKSPKIAVVLDVFPDHLDAHKNIKEYYGAKANIGRYQKSGDKTFFFPAPGKKNSSSKKVALSGKGKKIAVDENSFDMFSPDDLPIKGAHNFKNAVMAATIAEHLGVPRKTILEAVKNFRGLEHRLELARTLRVPRKFTRKVLGSQKLADVNLRQSHRVIKFYNDSASTNPQTAAAAIKAFSDEDKILIAGGQDKNLDYKPLASALKNSRTKLVVLFGENKRKIQKAIKNSGTPIEFAKNLEDAVRIAYRYSRFYVLDSRFLNIIFSPAAASFDMFEDYADRGHKFKKIVKGLK